MKIFISGGCKNGKSFYAQHLAKALAETQHTALYYIATMKPVDAEDNERILTHKCEREGWGFTTIEQPFDIEKILDRCEFGGSFLLDSLTALLANEMFLPGGEVYEYATGKITNALLEVLTSIRNIVIVSDYIYSDAIKYCVMTEKYRKSLAQIDCLTARSCDIVLEAGYSNIIVHKGSEIWPELWSKCEKIF